MIDVEHYEKAELEATFAELENLENNHEALVNMCQNYFTEFDVDKSGSLDKGELGNMMMQLFERNKLQIPLDKNFVEDWFVDLDEDHNGKVSLAELIQMMGPFIAMLSRMFSEALVRKNQVRNTLNRQ